MREGYLESRGIAYRTNDFVPGRPTLLLIHGFAGSSSQWAPYEKAWEHKFNLLLPDLRGHGKSKRWPHPSDYAPEIMAQDIIELCSELHIETCVVVGYSLGTSVALALWMNKPELLEKLILIGPLYLLPSRWRVRALRPFFSLLAATSRLLPVGAGHERIDYDSWAASGDKSVGRILTDFWHTGARSYAYNIKGITRLQEQGAWRTVTCPTLILHASHDSFVTRSNTLRLADLLPNARIDVIDADHMMVLNDSKEVIEHIEAFI